MFFSEKRAWLLSSPTCLHTGFLPIFTPFILIHRLIIKVALVSPRILISPAQYKGVLNCRQFPFFKIMQVSTNLTIQHTIHNITVSQLKLQGKTGHLKVLCKTKYNLCINQKGQILWNCFMMPTFLLLSYRTVHGIQKSTTIEEQTNSIKNETVNAYNSMIEIQLHSTGNFFYILK